MTDQINVLQETSTVLEVAASSPVTMVEAVASAAITAVNVGTQVVTVVGGADTTISVSLSAGPQGSQGIQGDQGDQGPQGQQGITGQGGIQGDIGNAGVQGDQGIQGVSGTFVATEVEIDVGATPVSSAVVSVVDAAITTDSTIIGGVAYKQPTGKDLDELSMDSFDLKFEPLNGTINVHIKGLEGSIHDRFIIWYAA
jgi:hypothetical protein